MYNLIKLQKHACIHNQNFYEITKSKSDGTPSQSKIILNDPSNIWALLLNDPSKKFGHDPSLL